MSITRYYYHDPFFSLSDFDTLFDDAFTRASGRVQPHQGHQTHQGHSVASGESKVLKPRMDLHEDVEKNLITATFEFPGLKKEDIEIDVHNNRLTVSGSSTGSSESANEGYSVRERWSGKFSRTLPLPVGTNNEEIKAAMEHGVLTVTFPRSKPEEAPKKIAIS